MALGNQGPTVIAITCVEVVLAGGFIATRVAIRNSSTKGVGIDDWVLIATWIVQLAFVCAITVSCGYGFGQHNKDLSKPDVRMATLTELIAQCIVSLAMGLSKSAVGLFLMRIVVQKWHKIVLWFWISTMMGWSILLAITVFAQCVPFESLYDDRVPRQYCTLDLTTIAYIMCSWSAAMDFFLAGFPWMVLWKLNMGRKDKITICVSLSLGILAGVCGIVRTVGLGVLSITEDYLFATAESVMWTSSELTITLICVCVPVLRPIWVRMLGGSTSERYYKQSEGSHNLVTIGRARNTRPTDTEIGLGTIRPDVKNANVTTIGASGRSSDDGSERAILRDNQTSIQRTREVTVAYEDKGRRD
ncbi:hypothetical protein F5Y00DRAFT_242092 [Daldinia vernicosa]|uniref:uncharacterized protein n=1 Tax=Daldinia vernicosa TaxID=114800 RepID=UPI002008A803|nr:uncharacterized protein F5Y00DRAFT_242092 [Daldinia vernicosa]KAI0847250.1 hypothetical protein F5Y00DRAFT_242092 [Daldinia vernicosa]